MATAGCAAAAAAGAGWEQPLEQGFVCPDRLPTGFVRLLFWVMLRQADSALGPSRIPPPVPSP